MPMRGDRYVIEIDGPYSYKNNTNEATEYFKVVGLNNVFVTRADLERIRKEGQKTERIKIGDEVVGSDGKRFVVTYISEDTLSRGRRIISGIDSKGYSVLQDTSEVHKTGRRHPELAFAVGRLDDNTKYLWE